jgi:hypothetical protein
MQVSRDSLVTVLDLHPVEGPCTSRGHAVLHFVLATVFFGISMFL